MSEVQVQVESAWRSLIGLNIPYRPYSNCLKVIQLG
jgi:hypothetical protein